MVHRKKQRTGHATHRTASIACIVEGRGEMDAVPILIRRIAKDLGVSPQPRIVTILASRGDFTERGHSKVVDLVKAARESIGEGGGLLILFDSDSTIGGECPAMAGPRVLRWATGAAPGVPICVVVAHHEYEAWFLAGASGLAGVATLPPQLKPPANPENAGDAKHWLTNHMTGRESYSPARLQALLTEKFNLREARSRADSFDKCYREIAGLLTSLTKSQPHADSLPPNPQDSRTRMRDL
jgi:hypothetical protein